MPDVTTSTITSSPNGAANFEISPRLSVSADRRVHIVWLGGQLQDRDDQLTSIQQNADLVYAESAIAAVPEFGGLLSVVLVIAIFSVIICDQ